MLVPLKLPPGIRDVGTAHQAKGRWYDCNFIRWVEGVMQPVGKWVRATQTPLQGRAGGILSMRDFSQRRWLAVGTHQKCYILLGSQVFDVTPVGFVEGYDVTRKGNGYGAAEYGLDEYGTPRTGATALTLEANTWAFDRWGEFIVATCVSDGRVFVWKPGSLDPAVPQDAAFTVIPNAPIDNRSLVVTNERHLMLLAAGGNPRKIQWSAREDYNVWTPTATNLAGDLELETSGTLQAAVKVGDDILILSDSDVFLVRYVGVPFGYGRERVGSNCGTMGPNAAVATNDFVVWMGIDGFYTYRGQVVPLPCDVWDFVFRDMNYNQRALVTAAHNAKYSEVWWFFPAGPDLKSNRYVIWNYRDNWWSVGYMERTAWQEQGIMDFPMAVGEDGHVYEQEHALNAPGVQPRPRPFAESSPFELGSGERVMSVTSLMPDRDSQSLDALRFEFVARFAPRLPPTTFGPFYPNDTGYTPCRFSGREVVMRVEANQDVDWRLGIMRAEVTPGGKR